MTSNTRRFFRGDAPQSGSPVLERRLWHREPARDADATLSWTEDKSEVAVKAHLQNISGGGAAVLVSRVPSRGSVLRLGLAAAPETSVEGRAVAVRLHQKRGWYILHVKFTAPCPRALYDQAVDDSDDLF